MKHFLTFVGMLFVFTSCQQFGNNMIETRSTFLDTAEFNRFYEISRETSLVHRRFKHQDIVHLIDQKKNNSVLNVSEIGQSFEGKSIYELQYGNGTKTVMLWSQMHGNEPTATMALFDLFNFLESKDTQSAAVRNLLKKELDIHFIPMLNPDGADRFTRRNAQDIDLNRDARANQTIEGKLLKQRAEILKPSYGFNLHDQNIYYNVPGTTNPVSISLLAPAYNQAREINSVRQGAMQIIAGMNGLLQKYIPDAVAKYDDTHSARGFGDNFQSWNASTVLIESGGMKGDPEKQEIRKLNFIIILNALIEIAEGTYKNYTIQQYENIPFNASQLHDLVLRNIVVIKGEKEYETDIAIRRSEITVGRDYYVRGRIEDIGDLKDEYGYEEVVEEGLSYVQGKVYPDPIQNIQGMNENFIYDLLNKGYIAAKVIEVGSDKEDKLHNYPFIFFTQSKLYTEVYPRLNGSANFFLARNGELKYAIVNGYLINLEQPIENVYKNNI